MEETLVWYHMEINNNIFVREAENLLSKIHLWPPEIKKHWTATTRKLYNVKTDKWGVLAVLEMEILADADLFCCPLLYIHTYDWENRLIMPRKTQTEDWKTPSPQKNKSSITKKCPFIWNYFVNETEKRKDWMRRYSWTPSLIFQ